ncbi:hypothetical protein D3C80_1485610 [compost metagenome]
MGIILVNRMIGVDDGDAQLLGHSPGHKKSAEFALGVNDIRLPAQQLLYVLTSQGCSDARSRIDSAGSERSDIGNVILLKRKPVP